MNDCFGNLHKIEFAVTMACTGRCKHCQNGDPVLSGEHIDAKTACEAVRSICAHYAIRTLMTFGGEPLLYPDTVCAIHRTARECGVGVRQLITNGYFSKNRERIESVVCDLSDSGVNDLLLSADAFHQENIPLEPVLFFAECAKKAGIPIRLSAAWLVSPEDDNPYNLRTREILRAFAQLKIPVGEGNVVFPSGNALKYLSEYFDPDVAESSPYDEDPNDIRTVSVCANGDVLNGNLYKTDVLTILRAYQSQNA